MSSFNDCNLDLILQDLDQENSGISQTNEILPDRKNEALEYINAYECVTEKLDKMQEMYDLLGEINAKKQQIVTLCNEAFNDLDCSLSTIESSLLSDGNILSFDVLISPSGSSNGTYNNIPSAGGSGSGATFNVIVQGNTITSIIISNSGEGYSTGDILTIPGTSFGMPESGSIFDIQLQVSQTDEEDSVVSETGLTFRSTGGVPPTYQSVSFGVIRRDRIRIIYYPLLEDHNTIPNTNNSTEGLIFPRITSGSTNSQFRGKGRSTILSANSSYNDGSVNYRINDDAGNWGIDGLKRGSGWSGGDNIMGNYYKLNSECGGRRTQINSLKNEISNLRSQIQELLDPINALKEKKHGYQLRSWSFRRSQKVNNDTINSNNKIKNILN